MSQRILSYLAFLFVLVLVVVIWFEYVSYQKEAVRDLEKIKSFVKERLLGIGKTATLQISPRDHGEIFGHQDFELEEFLRVRSVLRAVGRANEFREEIYTLRVENLQERKAKFVVMTGEKPYIGTVWVFPEEMDKVAVNGIAACTDLYQSSSAEARWWISCFVPFAEPDSAYKAVLVLDTSVDTLIQKHEEDKSALFLQHGMRAIGIFFLGIMVFLIVIIIIRKTALILIARPFEQILSFIHRVRDGILQSDLDIHSGDELEVLGDSFNEMVDGLRQKETMRKFLTGMELEEVHAISDGRKILEYGGEKKIVTVLFSDIRSFTTICEKTDPSLIIESLNYYFAELVPLIELHGGSLDKLIGDCIMAVFEERDGYNSADGAIEASIAMQKRLSELRIEMEKRGMPVFHAGFGINTGEAVVGNLGAKDQVSRTVLGDTINLAARVESLSKEGNSSFILLTEFTKERLGKEFSMEFLCERVVKGKTRPVKIYEISF